MTVIDGPMATETTVRGSYVQWGPVFAGAITAAAISSVLLAFASAAGFSVMSSAPTWRDASVALWLLAGIIGLLIALLAFGLGGYVAGRLRSRSLATTMEEREFRDGMHGLLAWGVAVLFGGVVAVLAAQAAAPAVALVGSAGASTSVAGENLLAYEVDKLFRSVKPNSAADMAYSRAEASRILLTTSGHRGLAEDDRLYLTDQVMERTGAPEEEAAARVDQAVAHAQDALAKARTVAVMSAFMTAAALLAGAAAAWFAAHTGGEDRERDTAPWWSVNRRRRVLA